jgi:hypothetical protein
VARHVVPADLHLTASRPDLAQHHADGRALARAVVAEQPEDFPARHAQGQVVHGKPLAEHFFDVGKLNHLSVGLVNRAALPAGA